LTCTRNLHRTSITKLVRYTPWLFSKKRLQETREHQLNCIDRVVHCPMKLCSWRGRLRSFYESHVHPVHVQYYNIDDPAWFIRCPLRHCGWLGTAKEFYQVHLPTPHEDMPNTDDNEVLDSYDNCQERYVDLKSDQGSLRSSPRRSSSLISKTESLNAKSSNLLSSLNQPDNRKMGLFDVYVKQHGLKLSVSVKLLSTQLKASQVSARFKTGVISDPNMFSELYELPVTSDFEKQHWTTFYLDESWAFYGQIRNNVTTRHYRSIQLLPIVISKQEQNCNV